MYSGMLAVSPGKQLTTFRKTLLPPHPHVIHGDEDEKALQLFETSLSLPVDTTLHPKKLASLATPLWKPHNSQWKHLFQHNTFIGYDALLAPEQHKNHDTQL